ncbi:MAG: hypothetical protein JNK15_25160, partial [Planctomycetes bacterium]|nr:hypothetical protein [Planctomycetota bacterium]
MKHPHLWLVAFAVGCACADGVAQHASPLDGVVVADATSNAFGHPWPALRAEERRA